MNPSRPPIASLLHYAVLAPSSHNTQPWRFVATDDGRLLLYADRTRSLPVVDPENRALVISCGAALDHLLVAIRQAGRSGEVHLLPDDTDPDLLASVSLGAPRTPEADDQAMFAAISERHTDRQPFEARGVSPHVLEQLQGRADPFGVRIHVVTEPADKRTLADLIAEGDRKQFHDADFRRELAHWMHPNHSRHQDGVPGYALGMSTLQSLVSPTVVRRLDVGKGRAAKDRAVTIDSPALLALSTQVDDVREWLATGRALSAVLLCATTAGLSASFMNQPIEVPTLRPRLAEALATDRHPQLLLRIGYGSTSRPTPRRSLDQALTG